MTEVNKENIIGTILSISYEDWISGNYSDTEIIKNYNYLREKMLDNNGIFKDYDTNKRKYIKKKCSLQNKLIEFQKASDALFLLNRVLLYNRNNNKEFETYFFATNTFINKLQNQYIFDISYHIQQKDGKFSMRVAFIALGFTVIFGIFSFDWKCEKSDLPDKIECLSDSIIILNEKIEQRDAVIKEFISSQKTDSVKNEQ